MDSRQLRYFIAVYEQRNLSRAAGRLIAREVIEPTLTRTLYLCRLRNRPMTYAMEEMRRLMLSLIAEQVGRGAWEATLLI